MLNTNVLDIPVLDISIAEALKCGREKSRGCIEHKKNMEKLANIVLGYTRAQSIDGFTQLKMHHVLHMIRDMEQRGHSPNYIRHVVNTIRLASNYMTDYYGTAPMHIEQRHLPAVKPPVKTWLRFDQLSKACEIALSTDLRQSMTDGKSHPRPMELGRLIVMVCGLCGLRLTEFGRLTREALVGSKGEWSLVIGDGDTRVKNESSKRVIPVMDCVACALIEYWNEHGKWSQDRSSNAKRVRILFQWCYRVTGDEIYLKVAPKNLRKTFVNELQECVDDKWIMAYGGWAFKGEMMRSYASLKPRPDDLPQVRDIAVKKLRDNVVTVIEKSIDGMMF